MKNSLPEVTFNKNGFEIRSDVLAMAKDQVMSEYNFKVAQFESSLKKDGDQIVAAVTYPTVPGVAEVLAAAEQFYNFVQQSSGKPFTSK